MFAILANKNAELEDKIARLHIESSNVYGDPPAVQQLWSTSM